MNRTRNNTTRLLAAGAAIVAALAGVALSTAPASALSQQKDAAAGDFPFFVDLGGCGGSLIAPEWVLTAGHCAQGNERVGGQVRVGWVSAANRGVTTTVRESYAAGFTDLALLRIDPVPNVRPIEIQVPQVKNGDRVTLVAAGDGSNGRLGSATFQVTDEPGALNTGKSQTAFTTHDVDGASTCPGDSGSPIITSTEYGPRLTGVHFASSSSCGKPGAYYAVSPQTPQAAKWITDTVGRPLGEYAIRNKNSGMYLDVNARGEIVQRAQLNSSSERWTFSADVGSTPFNGANPVNIHNYGTTQLLGVVGSQTQDGAVAVQWPDVNVADQSWSLVPTEGGYVKLFNNNSGKVLGIGAGSRVDGERAIQWTDAGVDDQQWTLQRISY